MNAKQRSLILVAGALCLSVICGPSLAHERSIEEVHGAGYDDHTGGSAIVSRAHDGVMKLTLVKRVQGEWKFVQRKEGQRSTPYIYNAIFQKVRGDRTCQIRARFVDEGHPDATGRSYTFPC
ncbi:MAG: hypothetical protein M3198_18460 [Actinomycetota bacterium]|nr:hypothetical protein [Actinomycetota bacterium]